jgi:predicted nucleotidyltransferase
MILDRFAAEAQEILGDNLVSLILFGSRARGNAHPDSDVDLLLVLKDLKEASPALDILDEVVLDLLLDHGLLLAMVPVETSEFDRQEGPLYRIVKRKGIRIL